ncbi:hypothetical protein CDL12_27989 [Handroanthus impetiginosus]|uniref:FBD domain-containing protein n=1 Tax=Handroanthus impetiginosus TaxID=429701 RepID=A0A2G9G2G6_9LAMI|nr:hypothetical protein CDL12_27989 [Handroanthus impetiginosus]
MLEHLHLCIYHQIERGDVEIDAPNLKSFCFQGILRSICFENTSLIEEIGITLDEESAVEAFQELEGNLIEFFSRVSSIKRLRLNGGFLQLLSKGEVPQKLSNGLSHLTFLQLSHLDFPCKAELSCALCLIRSSPNLRSLHIIRPIIMDIHDVLAAPRYLKEQKKIGLTFSQLEYVKIDGFSGIEPELRFVKLILSAAIRLEEIGDHV